MNSEPIVFIGVGIGIAILIASVFILTYWWAEHDCMLPRRRKVLLLSKHGNRLASVDDTQSGLVAFGATLILLNPDGTAEDSLYESWIPISGFTPQELDRLSSKITRQTILDSFRRINGEGAMP